MKQRYSTVLCLLWTAVASALIVSDTMAEIVQAPGTDYLVFEAEDFTIDELNNVDEDGFGTGWVIIDPTDPIDVELHNSNPGTITIPPPNANPSGGKAIFDLVGGGDFADQIGWELNFANPGEYFVYLRYSMYDMREVAGRNDYGHEDSIYIPPFDLQDDPAGSDPEIRDERAGQSSLRRNIGGDFTEEEVVDVLPTDGCRVDGFDDEVWQIEEADCEREEVSLEGQYHWQKLRFSDDSQENRHASYVIEETGTVLDFAIATRERGASLDTFVFSQNAELTISDLDALIAGGDPCDFDGDGVLGAGDLDLLSTEIRAGTNNASFDVNGDGAVDVADLNFLVGDESKLHTWIGDSNLDGEFNSSDFVSVFGAAKYETGQPATWSEGDWNGDGEFTSGDFVAAFNVGGYEKGQRTAGVAAVPEPSGVLLLLIGMVALRRRAR